MPRSRQIAAVSASGKILPQTLDAWLTITSFVSDLIRRRIQREPQQLGSQPNLCSKPRLQNRATALNAFGRPAFSKRTRPATWSASFYMLYALICTTPLYTALLFSTSVRNNEPQRAIVRRRRPHIPPPVVHLATDSRLNAENSIPHLFTWKQPRASLPGNNLVYFRWQSISCIFAAFCKRCRSLISPNLIPRPSVSSCLRGANQPLAYLALFARGAAARLRRTPFHSPPWPPTCA